MTTESIERKLGGIENLPTLPMVLRQIQKVMDNPNSNMAQIAAVVAKDQALASRTIRLVNSAYYGLRNRVPSIGQAIIVLGLNTLHNLMLGLSVVKLFGQSAGFDLNSFWQHSFGVALVSKKLGNMIQHSDPEECFIAGLLHDMGRLAVQQFLNSEFEKARKFASQNKVSLVDAEHETIGFDHAEAGGWLAARWKLHEILEAAIRFHHHAECIPESYTKYADVINIVSYANELCGIAGIGNSGENVYLCKTYPGIPLASDPKIRKLVEEAKIENLSVLEEWTRSS